MLATWPQIDPVRTSYFSDLFLLRKYFSRPKNYRRTGSAKLNGGGVLLYIRDNIPFTVKNELAANNENLLWVEINRPKCKPPLIAAAYKPPRANLDHDFVTCVFSPSGAYMQILIKVII